MARGRKKKRKRGGKPQHRKPTFLTITEEADLREGWDLAQDAKIPLEITEPDGSKHLAMSYEELRAWWKRDPMGASESIRKQVYDAATRLRKRGDLNRQLRESAVAAEEGRLHDLLEGGTYEELAAKILRGLEHTNASPEDTEHIKRVFGHTPDVAALLVATQHLEAQGITPNTAEVQKLLGWDGERADRVVRVAANAELLGWGPPEAEAEEAPASRFEMRSEDSLFHMPTMVVRRLSEMAREEKLPLALTEEEAADLPALGRHIVHESRLRQTEEGHHFIRAKMMLVVKPVAVDRERPGLEHLMTELLQDEIEPTLERWRQSMVDDGNLRQTEAGWEWVSERAARAMIDRAEADREFSRPNEREVDFPLMQFGTLLESHRQMPEPRPSAEMPIHIGARSFEPIWQHHARLWSRAMWLSKQMTEAAYEKPTEGLNRKLWDVVDADEVSRSVAAADVLRELHDARVVTVGIDVAEGLPEWDSMDEAWEYAQDAYPPFPITFLDFSTPGGYCPLLEIPTKGGSAIVTLRGALCMRDPDGSGPLLVRPFAWLESEPYDPRPPGPDDDPAGHHTDYDMTGLVSFSGQMRMVDGQQVSGQLRDPYVIMRTKGPPAVTGHAAVMRNDWITGVPGSIGGWTEIAHDLDFPSDTDGDEILRAHAAVALAAASRALSVLFALDSTVNIDLEEAEAPRPERRAGERAKKKGKPVEIAQTVMIRRTRYEDNGQPTGRKRDYSHAFWRRGGYAYYPLGTKMADALIDTAPNKLVEHPIKGTCRKVYRGPTIVGATDEEGRERRLIAKSYVWRERKK